MKSFKVRYLQEIFVCARLLFFERMSARRKKIPTKRISVFADRSLILFRYILHYLLDFPILFKEFSTQVSTTTPEFSTQVSTTTPRKCPQATLSPKKFVEKKRTTKPYFIGELGKCEKSASLTLSRYISKLLKRYNTHNSDSHVRNLHNAVIYF